MISKKSILCVMAATLLGFGCSSSDPKKNTTTPVSVNFIMPNLENDPFLFFDLNESLIGVNHGMKGKTVVIQTGSGHTEAFFDQSGTLKESFNPLSGHQMISGLVSNRLYLILYNQQSRFIYGITVFEKDSKVWIADVNISPDFSAQIRNIFLNELTANLSVTKKLESDLSNARQVDSKILDLSQLLAKSFKGDRANNVDGSAELSLKAHYAMIGMIEVGTGSLIRQHDISEITREFAGAALATISLMALSDEKKSVDLLKCLGNVEICKRSSDDPILNSSMELFSGLLSKDSNQQVLKNIVSASRLNWDVLADSTHRFFDPKIDAKPPSFKPIRE